MATLLTNSLQNALSGSSNTFTSAGGGVPSYAIAEQTNTQTITTFSSAVNTTFSSSSASGFAINNGTGVFTAQRSGVYLVSGTFTAQIVATANFSSQNINLFPSVNGTGVANSTCLMTIQNVSTGTSTTSTQTFNWRLSLNAGDTFVINSIFPTTTNITSYNFAIRVISGAPNAMPYRIVVAQIA